MPIQTEGGAGIAVTNRQIDALVYELPPAGMMYGLTEEEIKIVEVSEKLTKEL